MAWLCSVLDDSGQEASLGSETTQARIGLLCALCLWVGGVREAEVYMEGEGESGKGRVAVDTVEERGVSERCACPYGGKAIERC